MSIQAINAVNTSKLQAMKAQSSVAFKGYEDEGSEEKASKTKKYIMLGLTALAVAGAAYLLITRGKGNKAASEATEAATEAVANNGKKIAGKLQEATQEVAQQKTVTRRQLKRQKRLEKRELIARKAEMRNKNDKQNLHIDRRHKDGSVDRQSVRRDLREYAGKQTPEVVSKEEQKFVKDMEKLNEQGKLTKEGQDVLARNNAENTQKWNESTSIGSLFGSELDNLKLS